jgi:flagellar biosynthesis/type III secretory pathway chaperone
MTDTRAARFEDLVPLLDELVGVLREERAALESRDLDGIARASERKNLLAAELSRIHADIGNHTPTDLPESEPVHNSVRALLASCHHQNLVNGRIVRRSQQSVRELARILTGHEAEPLYDARGTQRASPYGTAITEA